MLVPRMSPGPTVVLLFIVDCAQGDRARVTFPESTYLYISTRQNEEPGVRQLFALVLLAGLYVFMCGRVGALYKTRRKQKAKQITNRSTSPPKSWKIRKNRFFSRSPLQNDSAEPYKFPWRRKT